MRFQAMKRHHRDVFGRRYDTLHEVDVAIEVAVVDRVDELAAQDAVDVLQVHDHPRCGVERTTDGDLDHVVVPVVGDAGAEDLAVLLLTPVVSTEDVSRGEGCPAGDANVGGHEPIRKLAPDSGADSGEASQTIIRATSAGWSAGPSTPAIRSIAVSTAPGLIALTRMPAERPSTATASVSPASPDLAAT